MLHPIFSVLVSKPELVLDHLAGYALLARDEGLTVGSQMTRRLIAWGVTLSCALLFLILSGVAVMVGAVHGSFHWALVVVPGIALAIAVAGFMVARKRLPEKAFSELRAQIDADAQALRAIAARS